VRALMGLLLLVGIVVAVVSGNEDESNGSNATETPSEAPEPDSRITGTFVRWEPVDDARGYAYFSITNAGPEDGVAKCTIKVSNDFGNFGFDMLVGEPIAVGETIEGRIPLDVGEGSFLINQGEVTNC
jgi:hypothetical protein